MPESVVIYRIQDASSPRNNFLLLGKETNKLIETTDVNFSKPQNQRTINFSRQQIELPSGTPFATTTDRENVTDQILAQFGGSLPAGGLFATLAKKSDVSKQPAVNARLKAAGLTRFSVQLRKSRGGNQYGLVKGGSEGTECPIGCIKREIEEEIGILPDPKLYPSGAPRGNNFLVNVSDADAQRIEGVIQARLAKGIGELEDLRFHDPATITSVNAVSRAALQQYGIKIGAAATTSGAASGAAAPSSAAVSGGPAASTSGAAPAIRPEYEEAAFHPKLGRGVRKWYNGYTNFVDEFPGKTFTFSLVGPMPKTFAKTLVYRENSDPGIFFTFFQSGSNPPRVSRGGSRRKTRRNTKAKRKTRGRNRK